MKLCLICLVILLLIEYLIDDSDVKNQEGISIQSYQEFHPYFQEPDIFYNIHNDNININK